MTATSNEKTCAAERCLIRWRCARLTALNKPSFEKFATIAARLHQHGEQLNALAAVALGDVDRVKKLHRENPRSVEDAELGLLTIAVAHDRIDMLRVLLEMGLDPDERKNRVGNSEETVFSQGGPLFACVESGQYEMAKLLLEWKADPNARVYATGTPIYASYYAQDERMSASFACHGGRIDARAAGLFRDVREAERILGGKEDHGRGRRCVGSAENR